MTNLVNAPACKVWPSRSVLLQTPKVKNGIRCWLLLKPFCINTCTQLNCHFGEVSGFLDLAAVALVYFELTLYHITHIVGKY